MYNASYEKKQMENNIICHLNELQRVPANKKPRFQVQPIVFDIVLFENRDLFVIQRGFLFADTRCIQTQS